MRRSALQFRQQYRPLNANRRYCYHVPLFVAVGTALTTFITEFQHIWYDSPGNSAASTTVRAYTFNCGPHHLLGWGVKGRQSVANFHLSSSNYYFSFCPMSSIQRSGCIHQVKFPIFRAFSGINKNNGEESWESESDENSDELDETFMTTLEDNNNYEGDDDDDDDYNDPLDQNTDADQTNNNVVTANDTDSLPSTDTLTAEYQRWSTAVKNAMSALEKKKFSLEKEFAKAEQLESLQTRGQYLQSYRHMFTNQVQSAAVQDWDTGEDIILTLDANFDSIGDEIDAIFSETKKLKRGKKVVGTLLDQTINAIDSMNRMKSDFDVVLQQDKEASNIDSHLLRVVQDRLVASAQVTNFKPPITQTDKEDTSTGNSKKSSHLSKPVLGTPASNIRKVISPAGCTILVGRNRRGNEYLSLNIAKKKDIWMHARDIPGAHVVVLQRRGGMFATDECFQLAANLAAFYSDGRSERKVPVSAAEPKHIQKPRGAPLGAVKLREELRVYSGRPDAVPDEFKEARAVSGLSDEYRITDKSKLRKQNKQQHAEQKQATKRKLKENSERQEQADKFY